jgi:hypothetical protein
MEPTAEPERTEYKERCSGVDNVEGAARMFIKLPSCKGVEIEVLNRVEHAVLRIRDVYPGSRIRIFSIPDPNFFHPRSASKNLSILTQRIVSKLSVI